MIAVWFLRAALGAAGHNFRADRCYRWEFTDQALTEQLLLEEEDQPATVERGHAAVRYVNPTTGGDVMATIRAEFHRLREGTATLAGREVGSYFRCSRAGGW